MIRGRACATLVDEFGERKGDAKPSPYNTNGRPGQ